MTPEDATFILTNDPGMGCALACLSLFKGNDMWKTLLDAGLPSAIRKNHGARSDLLYRLGYLKNTDDAVKVLRAIVDDLNPKQRQTAFASEKRGSVVIADWMGAIGTIKNEHGASYLDEKAVAHFHALVGVLKDYGIEPNTQYEAAGRRGGKYSVSVLSEIAIAVITAGHDSPFQAQNRQQMEIIWQLSPKLDDATKLRMLSEPSAKCADQLVMMFEKNGWAKREDWLSVAANPAVNKQTLAYMQAKVAMEAVNELVAGAAPGVLPKPTKTL